MSRKLSLAIAAALLGAASSAQAITDTETNASIQFNLSNPGARSLGMGGAFLGLADDATAAYTNPAGLTQLSQFEVSAEYRYTGYDTPFVDSGSARVDPFSPAGLEMGTAESSTSGLSYLSVVWPRDRWSFAFYRHELANFDTSFSSAGAEFGDFRLFPASVNAELDIVNYGLSAAWKANDIASLGAGLSWYDFDFDTIITRQRLDLSAPQNRQIQSGNDRGIGLNLGARFNLSDKWSAGLVYRHGPSFRYEATNAVFNNGVFNEVRRLDNVKFDLPEVYGAGLSFRPTEQFTVSFDANFIEYSDLTDGIESIFGNDPSVASRLKIPDGTELRLGAEYTFAQMSHPFSVRGGIWRDPEHSVHFDGDPATLGASQALATLFASSPGTDVHYSAGFGWAFESFQIDAAVDFSDQADTASVSGVWRF